jgi:hypothetical protein
MKAAPAVIVVALITVYSSWASPGPSSTPSASPLPACTAQEFRQFDFWLGQWKVTDPQGKQVGVSEISRASEGCAIREQWKSASGVNGMSINYYDKADQKWHQDWVGGDGLILHLHGGLSGSAMVLSGQIKNAKGILLNRISWTPLPEGKVKQEWATSPDDGHTWQIIFTGIYQKQS